MRIPCCNSRATTAFAVSTELRSIPSIRDRKSTRLNSSHLVISYAVFCLKKKTGNPGRVSAVARLHHARPPPADEATVLDLASGRLVLDALPRASPVDALQISVFSKVSS